MELNETSEVCEDIAILWLEGHMERLDQLLRKNGVQSRVSREEILCHFFFTVCCEFDGSPEIGTEFDGKEYRPVLGFSERSSGTSTLHVSDSYDLHDYVHSAAFNILDAEETDG